MFKTLIPRSVRLSEAPSFGEPVLTLDPSSRGSVAYRLLAVEVEERYQLPVHVPPPPPKVVDVREKVAVEDTPSESGVDVTDDLVVVAGDPGPRGRGFGSISPIPEGIDTAYPIEPWRIL